MNLPGLYLLSQEGICPKCRQRKGWYLLLVSPSERFWVVDAYCWASTCGYDIGQRIIIASYPKYQQRDPSILRDALWVDTTAACLKEGCQSKAFYAVWRGSQLVAGMCTDCSFCVVPAWVLAAYQEEALALGHTPL